MVRNIFKLSFPFVLFYEKRVKDAKSCERNGT